MTIFPQLRVVNNRDGGHYADVSGMALQLLQFNAMQNCDW